MPINNQLNLLNLPDCVLGFIVEKVKQETAQQMQHIRIDFNDALICENSLKNLANTCWQFRGLISANKLTYAQANLSLLPRMLFEIDDKLPGAELKARGLLALFIYYLLPTSAVMQGVFFNLL